MNCKVKYFAQLQELTGISEEVLRIDFTDPVEFYAFLKNKYAFDLNVNELQLAVNDEFVSWDIVLKNDDEIIFIPPMNGG